MRQAAILILAAAAIATPTAQAHAQQSQAQPPQAQRQDAPPPQAQPQARAATPARPRIGIALGGGSARGFAHVGVLRWFEEHHIPVDVVAGTSMGGLIGGAFATGMNAKELEQLLANTDWNEMFGASSYAYKNIRRKQDARAYPSRLEFGLKGGLALPSALNNGQHVDFMLARITSPYHRIQTFDELPTPFRCIAVDLRSATQVVLDRGPLAQALRATMSLPGVFPPVELDGRILVDGGAMNNVPADVVRAMGADIVIAVNVGSVAETRTVSNSLLGLIGNTIDAMMVASTRRGMADANIVITPPLKGFGSLDWRRAKELAEDGYNATEGQKDSLLKLAVDDAEWERYLAARAAKRLTTLPVPATLAVSGATKNDERRIRSLLEPSLGQPLDLPSLEEDLQAIGGMDRYLAVRWDMRALDGGPPELLVQTRPKPYGPPFLMLSATLQNTTSTDFSFQLAGRYLRFDLLGVGSELRLDAAVGSNPNLAAEIYRPIGLSPLFVSLTAGIGERRLNFIDDDAIVAQYDQRRSFALLDVGLNVSRISELRVGIQAGRLKAQREVGDPGLPSLSGSESLTRLRWIYDTQNDVLAPSTGSRLIGTIRYVFQGPELPPEFTTGRSNDSLGQMEIEGSRFWSIREERDRLFVTGGAGASFHGHPFATDQFPLGQPMRLGAFDPGEVRGDHYMALTGGYLRGLGRLPDFLGGPVFLGGWLENGAAYNSISDAELRTHLGFGVLVDTLLGPAVLGATFGFDGQRRYYVGLGRIWP